MNIGEYKAQMKARAAIMTEKPKMLDFANYLAGLLPDHEGDIVISIPEGHRDMLVGLLRGTDHTAALEAQLGEARRALEPFARTGWMTSDTEHTARTIVVHMHPEREREIILSSDDFRRAEAVLQAKEIS